MKSQYFRYAFLSTNKKIDVPNDVTPQSPTEQIVRKDVDKLKENINEIRKLKKEISKKRKNRSPK